VRLAISSTANIPAGAPVELEIDAEEHRNVVVVPVVAIVREGETTSVFVVSAGKAGRRPVQVGLTDGTLAEIVSGIKAGETVIVDGQAGLPDEAKVNVASAATPGEKAPEK
jgi:hypothetical protein